MASAAGSEVLKILKHTIRVRFVVSFHISY